MPMTPQSVMTKEGAALFANAFLKNDATLRGTDLQLMLFTAKTGATLQDATYAGLTEVTGGNYARKVLTNNNWSISGGVATYAPQVFVPTGSNYTSEVKGAAIVTTGATPKILFISVLDTGGLGQVITVNNPFVVTPTVTLSVATKGDKTFFLDFLLNNNTADRGTGLKCILRIAGDGQPTSAGGYAPVTIVDASWTINGSNIASTSAVSFTPISAAFSAAVIGYSIVTNSGKVIAKENDPTGAVTIPINTPYIVTPTIALS